MDKGSSNASSGMGSERSRSDTIVDIDLYYVFRALISGKWIIISTCTVFILVSVWFSMSLPNRFQSTAVLAPVAGSASGFNSLSAQLSGVASLAGISLNGQDSNKTMEAIEILKSWAFIEEFIREQNISHIVMGAVGWDPTTRELEFDTEVYDSTLQEWVQYETSVEVSSWNLFVAFKDFLEVSPDKTTGFVRVTIEHYSPDLAKEWVDKLVSKLNQKIRLRDFEDAQRNIDFLKSQIKNTSLASMQSVFYQLIEDQTKTLMLANATNEYVFKTISSARVAEQKSSPKRFVICAIGALLGFVLGALFALVFYFVRK